MNTGLKPPFDRRIVATIASAMSLFASVQASITLLALTEGDLACRVSALEPLDALFRIVQQRRLLGRNLEIGHADRDAAHGGVAEPELLQLVEELHRRTEAGAAIALEHQLGEILFPHL